MRSRRGQARSGGSAIEATARVGRLLGGGHEPPAAASPAASESWGGWVPENDARDGQPDEADPEPMDGWPAGPAWSGGPGRVTADDGAVVRAGRSLRPAAGRSALAALIERLPPGVRVARFVPHRRAVVGLTVIGALAGVLAVAGFVASRPAPTAPAESTAAGGSAVALGRAGTGSPHTAPSGPAPAGSPSPPAQLMVDVVGAVRRPGVVRVTTGSRVQDALQAAGGLRPDALPGLLNLAEPLRDGEQIVVAGRSSGAASAAATTSGTSGGATSATGTAAGAPGTPVDLNTATAAELDVLPGVGPVLAQRIVTWRESHGPFTSVEQLRLVGGIGDKRLDDLRPLVRL